MKLPRAFKTAVATLAIATGAQAETVAEHSEALRRQAEQNRSSPREITLRIVDEDGKPIENAETRTVEYSLRLQLSNEGRVTTAQNGTAVHHVAPYFAARDIYVDLGKADKHIGKQAYEVHLGQQDYLRYDPLIQSFNLTLPYVHKPIPLKARNQGIAHKRMNGPADDHPDPRLPDLAITEVGYDAELLEPVEPIGRGKHADFFIKVSSSFFGLSDYHKRTAELWKTLNYRSIDEARMVHGNWTHTVTFRFPNKGDGIVLSSQFWPYCKLEVPHKAPDEGYASELSLSGDQDPSATRPDLTACRKLMHNNGLFIRIRTQLDKDGNVVTANYAKILCPGVSRYAPMFSFNIFYNPTPNDRNLEYDFKTNLRWKELHPNSDAAPTSGDYWLDSN